MELVAEIQAVSKSNSFFNVVVKDSNKEIFNIKIDDLSDLKIGELYKFILEKKNGERVSYNILSYTHVNDLPLEEKNKYLREFYNSSPISLEEEIKILNEYLSKVENKIIYDITNHIMNKFYNQFLISPAASKMHHAYVGGLAYHTIGMLKLADAFVNNYTYLKKDYLYAGIILHDIGKVKELAGNKDILYTLEGQLLGHLVIGVLEIDDAAKSLGYENSSEVLFLKHMMISHHGIPQYGSSKKPMTAEAMALWFIDTIDSKFRVIGERLDVTDVDTWTDAIGVIDKTKLYKY